MVSKPPGASAGMEARFRADTLDASVDPFIETNASAWLRKRLPRGPFPSAPCRAGTPKKATATFICESAMTASVSMSAALRQQAVSA